MLIYYLLYYAKVLLNSVTLYLVAKASLVAGASTVYAFADAPLLDGKNRTRTCASFDNYLADSPITSLASLL